MSAGFVGAREREKWRAPFLGEDFVDVTRTGRLPPDASNRGTSSRYKEAAQTATSPRRVVSL